LPTFGDGTDLLKSYRYDRIKDIQELVELCTGHDIHWMYLGAQEKPQASTTLPVFNVKPSVIHKATGYSKAKRESVDLDRPTKRERASI